MSARPAKPRSRRSAMACFAFADSTTRAPASCAACASPFAVGPSTIWCPAASSWSGRTVRMRSLYRQTSIFMDGPRRGGKRHNDSTELPGGHSGTAEVNDKLNAPEGGATSPAGLLRQARSVTHVRPQSMEQDQALQGSAGSEQGQALHQAHQGD